MGHTADFACKPGWKRGKNAHEVKLNVPELAERPQSLFKTPLNQCDLPMYDTSDESPGKITHGPFLETRFFN